MPSTEPIAIRANTQTLLKSLGIAAAALAGLFYLRGLRVETIAFAVLILVALPLVIRRALDTRPLIVIDEKGIDDRRLGLGTIAWRDIRRAYSRSLGGASFICLEFADPERTLSRLPFLRRALGQFWRLFGVGPDHVATAHLEMGHDEIFQLVLDRCESSAKKPRQELAAAAR